MMPLSQLLGSPRALTAFSGLMASAYVEFFAQTVPTPLGILLAAVVLPTGDVIRWVTTIISRRTNTVQPAEQ